jgi:hypothetical protein
MTHHTVAAFGRNFVYLNPYLSASSLVKIQRDNNNNNNNNNNNLLTASGLSPGGSGYFTFKLRQTY